ncbi:MAG: hypothetical protein ACTSR8_20245 [Promethearchaeota archaeon]
MPGFAHLLIGLGISIFLYKVTEGKFTTKHMLVFTVNNLFGPDIASFFPTIENYFWQGFEIPEIYYFFHGPGWVLIALLLTLPWHWAINHKEQAMKIQQVYFLIVAGGLLHLFVDIIGHPSYINYNGQENYPWGVVWIGWDLRGNAIYISIIDIWGTGMFPCGNHFNFIETLIFYPICMLVFFGVLFSYSHKSERNMIRSFIFLGVFFLIPLTIFYYIPDYSGFNITAEGVNYYGNPENIHSTYRLVGGEADFGVLLYFGVFFSIPFILIYYSFNDKLEKPGV